MSQRGDRNKSPFAWAAAKSFCLQRLFQSGVWFNKYAANCAGGGLFIGDVILTSSGIHNGSWIEALGGGCFLASSLSMACFGRRDSGFNASLLLANAGVGLVTLEDLAHGKPGAWIGFLGYVIISGLGLGTNFLEKEFRHHSSWIVRNTLGRPREHIALLYSAFTVPLYLNAEIIRQEIAYGIYIASDLVLALSKPEQRQGNLGPSLKG